MPFWTLFWLIVPAVALLVVSTWQYRRGRGGDENAASDERRKGARA